MHAVACSLVQRMEGSARRVNPFGLQLRFFRIDRGMSLSGLADALARENISLNESILSAIETGRRGPLRGDQLAAVCKCLQLSGEEAAALAEAGLDSARFAQIPREATPRQFRLVHRLIRKLPTLSERQIAAIHATLDHDPTSSPAEEAR